jgi:hypothetical protein
VCNAVILWIAGYAENFSRECVNFHSMPNSTGVPCALAWRAVARRPHEVLMRGSSAAMAKDLGIVIDRRRRRTTRSHGADGEVSSRVFISTTSAGSRMVNVDPIPRALSTVTSPPIIWQKLRVNTNPSPVPP